MFNKKERIFYDLISRIFNVLDNNIVILNESDDKYVIDKERFLMEIIDYENNNKLVFVINNNLIELLIKNRLGNNIIFNKDLNKEDVLKILVASIHNELDKPVQLYKVDNIHTYFGKYRSFKIRTIERGIPKDYYGAILLPDNNSSIVEEDDEEDKNKDNIIYKSTVANINKTILEHVGSLCNNFMCLDVVYVENDSLDDKKLKTGYITQDVVLEVKFLINNNDSLSNFFSIFSVYKVGVTQYESEVTCFYILKDINKEIKSIIGIKLPKSVVSKDEVTTADINELINNATATSFINEVQEFIDCLTSDNHNCDEIQLFLELVEKAPTDEIRDALKMHAFDLLKILGSVESHDAIKEIVEELKDSINELLK